MSESEKIQESNEEKTSTNKNNNNELNLNNTESKTNLKNGQFILTPLESLLINKKMPFGFKLDTEENILKSIENAKMKKKSINSESIHRSRPKKISEFINYNNEYNEDGKKYFRERKQINKEDYKQIGGKISMIKKCEKCLEKLKLNQNYHFFYNSSSFGNPCLSEIEKNIKNNKYKSNFDFFMDLRKVWNYYYQTYYSEPDVYQKTCKMSELSEELFKNFDNIIEDKKPEINQLKEKLNNIEKGLNDMKSKGNLPQKKSNNYDKPMSMEEKNILGNAIRNLNKEQLKGIIKLLRDSKLNQSESGQNKYFEFDIDKLPLKKLRELEKYVKDCEKDSLNNREKNKEQNEQIQKLKDGLRNNNNEKNINKEEKNDNIFTNILKLTEDNSRNERNKLKKFRKSKDLYSTIKEENEENKKLFLKTVRYKNNISELCDKINNTCTDFNTTLNGRPKFRFVSQKEIQDSVTKKDLDVNSMRKPKVNAFQNMQLFREVNTLSALIYGLAYNGNNVIKEYLNKRNKKDNNYFTNSKSLNYEEVNKKRKEMFKKAKEIVRISQYCKDQCIKNIDKYNKEVENERMINN